MHKGRADSANKIKHEVLKMPQRLLNSPTKDPEEKHIPQQVHPPAVQKHAGKQGQGRLRQGDAMPREEQLFVRGSKPEPVNEHASSAGGERQFVKEGQHIDEDQQRIHQRHARTKDVHTQRDHRAFPEFSSISGVYAAGPRRPFRISSSIFSRLAIPPRAPRPMQASPAAAQLNSRARGSSWSRSSAKANAAWNTSPAPVVS